ncbi:capsule biosynthesis protein CapG [Enterococcus plantarum]|uniref:capsule biosynthesis protein CapG n=1 Tax=Enterococcus plantarum TaxID=1077675 RepID=UPI001A8C29ED|nr:capsule biosynthesis protein CapG [Enterococcus plantarum]MBO0467082.1 capsule biosynthesis protein CapG [Enterococcus plantarum]
MKVDEIDIVVLWVDESDEKWRDERYKALSNSNQDGLDPGLVTDPSRFRDWEIFNYWFRGIEKFAPWVRKIHFVSCGHIPDWLKKDHPKLNIVRHDQFLDSACIPTFNSRAIEVNLHKIEGLAEQFIYFNDDFFITNHVKPTDFFINGQPRDTALLAPIISKKNSTGATINNNMEIINKYISKKNSIKNNFSKWFNPKYGMQLLRTISLIYYNDFPGFFEPHIPTSYLKETYREVWELEYPVLELTSEHKFKSKFDVNQWLFRYWQIAQGNFVPRSTKFGKFFILNNEDNEMLFKAIKKRKYKVICINDSESVKSVSKIKDELKQSFSSILSEKSSYEL